MEGPPLDNAAVASRLDAIASLLELAGAGPYTARAYRRAADLIRSTPAPIVELVRAGRARDLRLTAGSVSLDHSVIVSRQLLKGI